jgi:hypothetical protein
LFELSYFSNGAINVDIAYNLPIHMRNFYYRFLTEIKEKEAKAQENPNTISPKAIAKPF